MLDFKILLVAALSGLLLVSVSAIAMDPTIGRKDEMTTAKKVGFSTDHLTDLQKHVTLEGGTERPFKNEYWDNKAEGIYVDVIDGTPLFSSKDKYESGTGWPSFTKPLAQNVVTEHEDKKLFMTRVEVKATATDSHLGHVFNDGPKEAGGLRYCMNSASLRFVPKDDLEKEGFAEYLALFK